MGKQISNLVTFNGGLGRQSGDKNSSANCQNVLQNSNSQIGHIVAEPLPHVITGKGPRNRSYSAQNSSLDKRPFDHAVNCHPANRRIQRGTQATLPSIDWV